MISSFVIVDEKSNKTYVVKNIDLESYSLGLIDTITYADWDNDKIYKFKVKTVDFTYQNMSHKHAFFLYCEKISEEDKIFNSED